MTFAEPTFTLEYRRKGEFDVGRYDVKRSVTLRGKIVNTKHRTLTTANIKLMAWEGEVHLEYINTDDESLSVGLLCFFWSNCIAPAT